MPSNATASMSLTPDHLRRSLALLASLLFNAAWVLAVLQVRFAEAPPATPPLELELVMELPAPPPPPPPPPVPETKKPAHKTPARVAKPAPEKLARPEQKAQAPADPGPPVHFLDPEGDVAEGSGAIGGGQGGTGPTVGTSQRRGMHVPSGYADAVKSRIVAARVYPAEAKQKFQECFVAYTVTVDRNGTLLSYDIDRCGHPLLDQAAKTAIEQAAPFPVPPDQGADRYDIHGSLVFRLR